MKYAALNNRNDAIKFVAPAIPGFYAVFPVFDESNCVCEAHCEPVIAWALDTKNFTWPVTVHQVDYDAYAILAPDGRVRAFEEEWKSLTAWLLTQKTEVRK